MECRLPKEVWIEKEVKIYHVRTFGYISYIHIDFDACSKLDAKSIKYYFIGYVDELFGYRFWDEKIQKIIKRRNIIFNEKVM